MIQDIAPKHLYNEWEKHAVIRPEARVLHFERKNLLCREEGDVWELPQRREFAEADEAFTYLFRIDGTEYLWLRDGAASFPEDCVRRDVTTYRTKQPRDTIYAVATAWHLVTWYRANRFCGRCGTETAHDESERMLRCPKCGNLVFPRINPSVIVAVTHGDRILLTQYANRPGATRTALIAGFTEIGETFEQTVRREVMEEVGLRVKNLRYYKCQPWGISGNLMMGFWCEVDGDDTIRLDGFELADGAWVSREELRRDYAGNSVALTSEMIQVFAAGREHEPVER